MKGVHTFMSISKIHFPLLSLLIQCVGYPDRYFFFLRDQIDAWEIIKNKSEETILQKGKVEKEKTGKTNSKKHLFSGYKLQK